MRARRNTPTNRILLVAAAALMLVGWPGSTARSGEAEIINLNMAAEAYAVRQDLTVPLELHLGRIPRAATEVSKDLTTGFAAYYDPGLVGRFGVAALGEESGEPALGAPAWVSCLFPESPDTPTEDTRTFSDRATTTAEAVCGDQESHEAGYWVGDLSAAGDGSVTADLVEAKTDAVTLPGGGSKTKAFSTIENLDIGGVVQIASITNRVKAVAAGDAGGASVETTATISGLTVNGIPIDVPNDSLEALAPVLDDLGEVVSPVGTLSFDVEPEQQSTSEDGTAAEGQAAQLFVSVNQGETTVTYGLGFARARSRVILGEPTADATSGEELESIGGHVGDPGDSAATSAGEKGEEPPTADEEAPTADDKASTSLATSPDVSGPTSASPPPSDPSSTAATESASSPQQEGGASPELSSQPTATNTNGEPFGGLSPWAATLMAALIGALLVRYLSWSTALRPVETTPPASETVTDAPGPDGPEVDGGR